MKRLLYILLFILPIAATSQNMYNIAWMLDNAPSGTARFIGMGGSMSSLGADISVMGINPAGTAIYRSSDFSLTGNVNMVNNIATYVKSTAWGNYNGIELGDLGFVIASKINSSSLKYLNCGINYRSRTALAGNFKMNGYTDVFSQQYISQKLFDKNPFDINKMNSSMYQDFSYNWLALLSADAGLFDEDGNILYLPLTFGYSNELRGRINEVDFNLSANFNDRIYVGATVGCHIVDYSRYSYYYEDDDVAEIYSLVNNYQVSGAGIDFKVGAIFRPFKYSPFKLGIAVHTPVIYRLLDTFSANIYGPEEDSYFDTKSEDCYGDNLKVRYSLRTPWRFNASASYTFGSFLALNAEYEYANTQGTSFNEKSDVGMAQNEEIQYNLKPQHTVRVGAECSFKSFAVRAGYNYISPQFKESAYKNMDNAVIVDTSTEYMNSYGKNIFTLGFGYVRKNLYLDVAYMMQLQNSDFYPYYDTEYANPVTNVNTLRQTVAATVGFRF